MSGALRMIPYLNSPTMGVAGSAAHLSRVLGQLAPQVEVAPDVSSVLEQMRLLNARVVALVQGAPDDPRVQTAIAELRRATANAASDLRYAPPEDASMIIADIQSRLDTLTELIGRVRAESTTVAPGEIRGFPGGATLLALAAVVTLAVGSVLLLAKGRRTRRR